MTMSRWTHSICNECYTDRSAVDDTLPEEPVRIKEPPVEDCCFCGEPTISGIYLRVDPKAVACGGEHGEEVIEVG